jgi:hypothetical protein
LEEDHLSLWRCLNMPWAEHAEAHRYLGCHGNQYNPRSATESREKSSIIQELNEGLAAQ